MKNEKGGAAIKEFLKKCRSLDESMDRAKINHKNIRECKIKRKEGFLDILEYPKEMRED